MPDFSSTPTLVIGIGGTGLKAATLIKKSILEANRNRIPPNVAILGVGRIHDAVRWEADRPVRSSEMTLSLTIDHRAVDGAPGAAFLATVRELLESPYRLLV